MPDGTSIEWTHRPGTRGETWNPIAGCDIVSPGCAHCYAMRQARRIELMAKGHGRDTHYAGTTRLVKDIPVWTGKIALAPEETWSKPLRWSAPRTIFVNSMSDLFHPDVPESAIDRVFATAALCPRHTFIILTKRSTRMRGYLTDPRTPYRVARYPFDNGEGFDPYLNMGAWPLTIRDGEPYPKTWPLHNVWLGVSAEDQQRADERVPDLLATPAAIRFVSAEPLLGPIRFDRIEEWTDTFADCGGHPDPHWPRDSVDATWLNGLHGTFDAEARSPAGQRLGVIDPGLRHEGGKLDWIIVGGESGRGARPMDPAWARSIRDQCAGAGTAFFFKQWGLRFPAGQTMANGRIWQPLCGKSFNAAKSLAGNMLDGCHHLEYPRGDA